MVRALRGARGGTRLACTGSARWTSCDPARSCKSGLMADKSPKRETAERPPRAHKQRKKVGPPRNPAAPTAVPGGVTGCEMGVASRTVEGRNGGSLTPYPPGSNGGVHRGPDKGIRRNVVRAIFMGALTD